MALINKPQPIGERVSAGLYRDSKGALVKSKTGMIPVAKVKPTATPTVAAPLAPPLAQPNPSITANPDPNVSRTLFPTIQPGSPLYQFQLQQGQKGLERGLAAAGQTKSGNAITEELNLPLRLAAADTQMNLTNQTNNADRLNNIQQFESNRLTNQSNTGFDQRLSLADLQLRQDPFIQAMQGFNTSGGFTNSAGQSLADFYKNAYQKVFANTKSGGGGGGAVAPTQSFPTGPDYSNIMPQQIFSGSQGDAGYGNIVTNLIGSLFK